MADTILIRRTNTLAEPPADSLSWGELAFSEVSGDLFIGQSDGSILNLTDDAGTSFSGSAADVTYDGSQADFANVGNVEQALNALAAELDQAQADIAAVSATGAASDISYDNTTSGLAAIDVQAALDELAVQDNAQDMRLDQIEAALASGNTGDGETQNAYVQRQFEAFTGIENQTSYTPTTLEAEHVILFRNGVRQHPDAFTVSGGSITFTEPLKDGDQMILEAVRAPQGQIGQTGATGATGAQGIQGIQGERGDTGSIGPAGDDGSQIYRGNGAPDAATGQAGDYYLDEANADVYARDENGWVNVINLTGPQGIQGIQGPQGDSIIGPQGIQGEKGDPGRDGEQWEVGAGTPDNAIGEDGDFYLDSTDGDVFERVGGAYVLRANIKGVQGDTGPQGESITGPAGPIGETGPIGPVGEKGDPGIIVHRSTGELANARLWSGEGVTGADGTVTLDITSAGFLAVYTVQTTALAPGSADAIPVTACTNVTNTSVTVAAARSAVTSIVLGGVAGGLETAPDVRIHVHVLGLGPAPTT